MKKRILSLFVAITMVLALLPAFSETALANTPINYARLLQTSLFFFDANMCGPQVNTKSHFLWRDNCHHSQDQDSNVPIPSNPNFRGTSGRTTLNLSGGFHDAGDHIKFQLPISFSKVTLGWAVHEYRDEFIKVGSLEHAERILEHYADFLRRCVVMNADGTPASFVYQVGDGSGGGGSGDSHNDHAFWGRPERQTGNLNGAQRRAYFTDLTAANPGTEQVAIAAAVLAQHYVNFGRHSGNTADRDLALALFTWADTQPKGLARRGVSTEGGAGRNFYRSQRWEDKLALAGEWLNIAFDTTIYRRTNTLPNSNWAYSWDNVWAQVGVLRENWTAVDRELNQSRANINSPNTYAVWPDDGWGSARYNAAMQGVALARDNRRNTVSSFTTWARGQMTFLLGGNPQRNSYVIGYPSISTGGSPTVAQANFRIHHRAAHTPTTQTGNSWTLFNANAAPANFLVGALIGGPGTAAGNFNNNIEQYHHTEVTCDYNASLALAAAGHLRQHPTHQPVSIATIFGSQNFRQVSTTPTAPVITSPNNFATVQGTAGNMNLTASGTAPITFTLSGQPTGVSISGSTLNVAATVAPGTHTFTIRASNSVGQSPVQNFTLTVRRSIAFNWNPTMSPADRNIANGANDHVRVLSGVNITPCIIAAGGDAALRINYVTNAGSSRRILAWTNLSSSASNVNSIAFLTQANITNGNVIVSDLIAEGTTSVTLTIPRRLLTSGTSTANRIFIAIATNQGTDGGSSNTYTASGNHRGSSEINTRFQSVVLTVPANQAATNPAACSSCSNLPCRCAVAPPNFTVTFDLAGGTHTGGGALTQSVQQGQGATAPTTTRTNFRFNGWNVTFNNIQANTSVIAQWIPTFAVTINSGGNGASATSNVAGTPVGRAAQGDTVTLNAGTHAQGWAFTGWTASGISFQNPTSPTNASFTMPNNNVTVAAGWQQSNPVNPTVTWPTGLTATVGQTLGQISLPNNSGTAGTFSWTAGNSTSVGAAGSRIHNLTFTPNDLTAFLAVSNNVTVTVTAANNNETVLYDMQTTDRHPANGFTAFAGQGGLPTAQQAPFAPLGRTGGTNTTFSVTDRTVSVTAREGVGQAVRILVGAHPNNANGLGTANMPIQTGRSYRIEYTASFGANTHTPRIRIEGGSGTGRVAAGSTFDGTPVATAGTSFTHSVTLTAAEISSMGAAQLSLSATNASVNITWSNVRIIELNDSATFPVTVQGGVTGVAVQGGPQFAAGATVTLNITPPAGQRLAANGISATGANITNAVGATQVTFTMPANAVTITGRTFQQIPPVTITTYLGDGRFETHPFQPGTTPNIPQPARSGFVFDGWDTDFSTITSNTTVNAQWLRLGGILSFLNGDTEPRITSEDVTWLARHVVNHNGFTLPCERSRRVADISGTGGNVTMADVTMLARWLVGFNIDDLRNGK
jgi:uncharacterized repeat protein (TIGR02543 family)